MKQTSAYLLIKRGSVEDGNNRFLSFMEDYDEVLLPDDYNPKEKRDWVFYEFESVDDSLWVYINDETQKFIDIKWVEYYDAKDMVVDYIDVYFRRGDLGNRKDMQVCGIVDYRDQIDEFEISDRMKEIYLVASIPKSWRQTVLDRVIESEDEETEDRWLLDKDKLSTEFKSLLYTEEETKATNIKIDNVLITDELILTGYVKKTDEFKGVKDVNAWVGGPVTIGTAPATYVSWVALAADTGIFSSNGTATQTSVITQTLQANVFPATGTYTIELDGADNILNHGTGNNHGIQISLGGTGAYDVHNFHFVRIINADVATSAALRLAAMSNTPAFKIHDNRFDGTGRRGSGLSNSNANATGFDVYNNIFHDFSGDAASSGILTTANVNDTTSVYENNTVYNCGIGIDFGGRVIHSVNNGAFDSTGNDFDDAGGLTTFTKCASSDATGSEVGLQSLTTADEFRSLVDTNAGFLWPTRGSLYKAGANTTITGHTLYYNSYSIVTNDEDIGANGLYQTTWVGGDVTVGDDGDFANWKDILNNIGTFTSNGTATQISDITEAELPYTQASIGTYTQILDGGNYLLTTSITNHHLQLSQIGTGVLEIRNFHFIRTTNSATGLNACIYINHVGEPDLSVKIHDNIFDGAEYKGSGIRSTTHDQILSIYNNIFFDCVGDSLSAGIKIDSGDGNANSIYENNTIYSCYEGIEINSNDGNALNNAVFDSTGSDYNDTGSLSTFSKCASSDATGSEVGLQSLTAATVFQSLDDTNDFFLWPVADESLHGAGANVTISGHIVYYNGVAILTDDVDIGANGLTDRPPPPPLVTADVLKRLYTTINLGSQIGSFY